MNHEALLLKAREAASPEELLALAKEMGAPMDAESAAAYFAQINRNGELTDEELDNVSGGGCYCNDGRLIVTHENSCDLWTCPHSCMQTTYIAHGQHVCSSGDNCSAKCKNCRYFDYEYNLWLCNHPQKKK